MISLENLQILTPLQKLPMNVEDLGKKLWPKALKSCPKSNKSPNLVTLMPYYSLEAVGSNPSIHGKVQQCRLGRMKNKEQNFGQKCLELIQIRLQADSCIV